jgi:hypothetical protein
LNDAVEIGAAFPGTAWPFGDGIHDISPNVEIAALSVPSATRLPITGRLTLPPQGRRRM